jgi:hypothetical protein
MKAFLAIAVLFLATTEVQAWGHYHYRHSHHMPYGNYGYSQGGGYLGNGPIVVPRGWRPYRSARAGWGYYGWEAGGTGW